MSFNPNVGRNEYTANASQTVFTFDFKVFLNTDIQVYLTPTGNTPSDTNDLLVLTTDYNIVISGDTGGTVTLTSAASAGDAVTLVRVLPISRYVEFQNNGDLLASTLNLDQDYQTYLTADQQVQESRHISIPQSAQGISTDLPNPQPLKALRWNSTGDALENVPIGENTVIVNIFNVDSIAELATVSTNLYTTVNVRGYYTANDGGGGIFNYDATQSAVNNGGTIINGWVRQYSGTVNVKWFGAVGDGITDDTSKIQLALNTGKSVQLLDDNNIKFTVIYPLNEQTIFGGDGIVTAGQINILNVRTKLIGINFDIGNVPAASNVEAEGSTVVIDSCTFKNHPNNHVIRFGKSNIDILNCLVSDCVYGIKNLKLGDTQASSLNGRVNIRGNSFINITNEGLSLITLQVITTDPLWEDGWLEANSFFSQTIISNNIFQNCGSYAFIFRGWNCIFSGNSIKGCSSVIFQGGLVTVVGNDIRNSASMGIDFGNVELGTITGNIITRTDNASIEINACKEVTVVGNILGQPSLTVTTGYLSSAIWVHGLTATTVPQRKSENIIVSSNNINKDDDGLNKYCVAIEDADSTVNINDNNFVRGRTTITGAKDIVSASTQVIVFNNTTVTTLVNLRTDYNTTLFPVVISDV